MECGKFPHSDEGGTKIISPLLQANDKELQKAYLMSCGVCKTTQELISGSHNEVRNLGLELYLPEGTIIPLAWE